MKPDTMHRDSNARSGAIASSIRRVVNQRLKNNAMFWRESGAKSMLQFRAQVVSNRWDESNAAKQSLRRHTRLDDWRWVPSPDGPPETQTPASPTPQKPPRK